MFWRLVSSLVLGFTLITALTGVFFYPRVVAGASLCVNPGGTGGCYTKIQDAIDNASNGDVVLVAAGTYTEHITMTNGVSIHGEGWNTIINGNYSSPQPTVYVQPGVSASTVLSGVQVTGGGTGSVTSGSMFGGGIAIWYASPQIINTWVNSCTAQYGGGIYVKRGSPTLNNVPVWNSRAEYGGGFYIHKSEGITITGVINIFDTNGTIYRNSATTEGGGIYIDDATATLTGLRISENTAAGTSTPHGGGIYVRSTKLVNIRDNWIWLNAAKRGGSINSLYATNLKITNNTIFWNTADYGGGANFGQSSGFIAENSFLENNSSSSDFGSGVSVFGSSGTITLHHNWFEGNSGSPVGVDSGGNALINANTIVTNTAFVGGGIALFQAGAVTITNNIIADNSANLGGGVWIEETTAQLINNTIADNSNEGIYFSQAEGVVIVNNIISGNSGDGIERDNTTNYTTNYNNVYNNSSNYTGLVAGSNDMTVNPLFVAAGNNLNDYYHLQSASLVNATGNLSSAPEYDIDGQPRLIDGTVSMGADEYVGASLTVIKTADLQQVESGSPITYTIYVTNTGDLTLTATITDFLPSQVTPNGTSVWTATIPAPDGVWIGKINVTINAGYTGSLTNVVHVSTGQGASGQYTHTLSPPGSNSPANTIYLPIILRSS
jgi:uncharacterized repeat protein (TIGR01451 family)